MRLATVQDVWRDVDKTAPRLFLNCCTFTNIPGISDGEIQFQSALTAICGPNGAGKSALLKSIWAALHWDAASKREETIARIGDGNVSAQLTYTAATYTASMSKLERKCEPVLPTEAPVAHIESAKEVFDYKARLTSKGDPTALIVGGEKKALSDDERKLLSYVCGKDYSSISVVEIEDIEPVTPFFTVVEYGVTYDSRTMSMGELAAFLVFWTIRSAEMGSLILLEEPESFISPIGQAALINMLAALCVKKKAMIIFTTHSPQLIAPLSSKQKVFIMRSAAKAAFMPHDAHDQSELALGLSPPRSFILAFEDRAAKELARFLMALKSPKTLKKIFLSSWEGASKITNVLRIFARDLKTISIIGVFDGDQRASAEVSPTIGKYVFLPGITPIEEQFRNVTRFKASDIASRLEIPEGSFTAILAGTAGHDHHEWFEQLVMATGFSFDHVFSAFTYVWLSDEANERSANTFVEEINTIIDKIEAARRGVI